MGRRKTDTPESRKLAIMRAADTEATTNHTIGGLVRKHGKRPTPSLPKLPWQEPEPGEQE